MSIKTTRLYTYILLAVTLASCEKTIEFKSAEIKPKIVVNAVFTAGSKYKYVKVEKSRSILDDRRFFEALPNAAVKLYEDGNFISELGYISIVDTFYDHLDYGVVKEYPYESGIFIDSTVVIKPGSTYRLEISNEGFGPVTCETIVPVPVKLDEMKITMEKIPKQYNENFFKIKLRLGLNDPQEEDNFYRLTLVQNRGIEAALKFIGGYNGSYGGSIYYGGGMYGYGYGDINLDSIVPTDTIIQERFGTLVQSLDPVLSASGNADILDVEADAVEFFTDELMTRENYQLSFWIDTGRDVYVDFDEYLESQALIHNISRELYYYSVSRQQQSLAIDNPFAEPVPVYSNIAGGIGIFGSVAISSQHATIGNYPVDGKVYIDAYEYNRRYYNYPD